MKVTKIGWTRSRAHKHIVVGDVWLVIDGMTFRAWGLFPLERAIRSKIYWWAQVNLSVPKLYPLPKRDEEYLCKRAWTLVDPLSPRSRAYYIGMPVDIKDLTGAGK